MRLILDTETTGLNYDAEICEIAIINETGKTLLNTLVKPLKPIPQEATAIHGITNEMVASSPQWSEIHPVFCSLVTGNTLFIYNASFDLKLLRQTAALYDFHLDWLQGHCVMLEYAKFKRGLERLQRILQMVETHNSSCAMWC